VSESKANFPTHYGLEKKKVFSRKYKDGVTKKRMGLGYQRRNANE
jgi:hypothetical protein